MFNELITRLPDNIIIRLQNCMQGPKWHPEGSVYNHMKNIASILPNDINLQIANIFHDLGKLNTTEAIIKKGILKITSYGHEDYADEYINDYKELFDDLNPDWDLIRYICINHMDAHNFANGSITKKSKVDAWTLEKYHSQVMEFEKADSTIPTSKALPIVILTLGIPGSGKSTWRNEFITNNPDFSFICPDDLRKQVTGDISNISQDYKVWQIAEYLLKENILERKNTVFDSTMCSQRTVTQFQKIANDSIIVYKIFAVDPVTANERIAKDISNNVNRSKVPSDVVYRMFSKFSNIVLNIKVQAMNNEVLIIKE